MNKTKKNKNKNKNKNKTHNIKCYRNFRIKKTIKHNNSKHRIKNKNRQKGGTIQSSRSTTIPNLSLLENPEISKICNIEASLLQDILKNDSYKALGLLESSSLQEIKTKYRKLSLLLHPDKCDHKKSEEYFIALTNHYNKLKEMHEDVNSKKYSIPYHKTNYTVVSREKIDINQICSKLIPIYMNFKRMKYDLITNRNELIKIYNSYSKNQDIVNDINKNLRFKKKISKENIEKINNIEKKFIEMQIEFSEISKNLDTILMDIPEKYYKRDYYDSYEDELLRKIICDGSISIYDIVKSRNWINIHLSSSDSYHSWKSYMDQMRIQLINEKKNSLQKSIKKSKFEKIKTLLRGSRKK